MSLPTGACDAHCHVFGPVARFPFSPDRTYTPEDAGFDDLLALHDHLGIGRGVIVQASCHGTDNAALLDALRRGGGRYAGVAMVADDVTDDELARLHDAGVRGVRFNFVAHLGGPPALDRLRRCVDRIRPLGWHLVVHLDAADLQAQLGLLRSLPLAVVIDHMARMTSAQGPASGPFRDLLGLLADDRFWVKISCADRFSSGGPPYDDMAPMVDAVMAVAAERVLWGTDWPHPNVAIPPDDGGLVDLVGRLLPTSEQRRMVLVDNPARLYPFAR